VNRSLKATFAVLLASLTLGGVAAAAIGSSSDDEPDDRGRSGTQPSSSAPDRSAPESAEPDVSGSSSAHAPADHPSQAQDTEAHCRAYESVRGRGNALNSTAWQRLITAAGGEENVAAYCAEQLGEDTEPTNGKTKKADSTPSAAATSAATPASSPTPKPAKSKGKP
jgi:hypothetical protein